MVLLSDPWWLDPGWWLAIVLGIVGSGLIGVLIYRKQRTRKQITYQIISDAPIVNIDKRVEGKVKIIDKDSNKELIDANLISLKIWNSGDIDVKVWNAQDHDVQDMETPITFQFEGRTVVSLTELDTDPPEEIIQSKELERYLNKPSPESFCIGLPRCLLERHQTIKLSVLVNGPKGKITQKGKLFQGHILNFDTIKQKTARRRRIMFIASIVLVILSLSSLVSSYILRSSSPSGVLLVGVTPADTSAGNMAANVLIIENQDALYRSSIVNLQMSVATIKQANFALFDHGEYIVCNGVKVMMGHAHSYPLIIDSSGKYTCSYSGFRPSTGLLSAVTMIDLAARSRLHPKQPTLTSQGYMIGYTPDTREQACSIKTDAEDSSGNIITGNPSSSVNGVYNGPITSSLTGTGLIRLTRTCSWAFQNAFSMVSLTYESTASVEVSWGGST